MFLLNDLGNEKAPVCEIWCFYHNPNTMVDFCTLAPVIIIVWIPPPPPPPQLFILIIIIIEIEHLSANDYVLIWSNNQLEYHKWKLHEHLFILMDHTMTSYHYTIMPIFIRWVLFKICRVVHQCIDRRFWLYSFFTFLVAHYISVYKNVKIETWHEDFWIVDFDFAKSQQFSLTSSCGSRQRDQGY